MKLNANIPYEFVTFDRYICNKNVHISERHINKNHIVPMHWHEFFELEVVFEGSATHIINNTEFELKAGSAYIITYCDFHQIIPHEDLKIFNLSFMPSQLNEKLANEFYTSAVEFISFFDNESFNDICDIFKRALNYKSSDFPFEDILLNAVATEIIIYFLKHCKSFSKSSTPIVIQQAINIINSNFCKNITLLQTAEKLNISPNYLGSLFKKQVGISFNRYLNNIKLEFACGQLLTSQKSIKKIALESGFCSVEYFLSVFKRYIGMTPTEFKTLNSKSDNKKQ